MEELDNVIVLTDEDGEDVEFEFLDLVELGGAEYVVLLPVDEAEDGGEVLILRVEDCEEPDLETYVSVEDDGLLERVFGIFKERFAEEFNFVD